MKKIAILGSTGSIGTQTLDICRWFKDDLQVIALAAGNNWQLLAEQALEFRPQVVALAANQHYQDLKQALSGTDIEIICGEQAAEQVAELSNIDSVVAAIVGLQGLPAVLAAITANHELILANKEALVAGGFLTMPLAKKHNCAIIPADSEHSAIYQCLLGERDAKRLILTASGGSLRHKSLAELATVTVADALNHPNWSMGNKITIDSASMVNKGLEIIEAHWLFGFDYQQIEVLIHPESIVHSLVLFGDGAVKGLLSPPDMRLTLQYALLLPKRPNNPVPTLDLAKIGSLNFEKPDFERFKALKLAYQAGQAGNSHTIAYNAANEVLAAAFLKGRIKFPLIGDGLEQVLCQHQGEKVQTAEDIFALDKQIRAITDKFVALAGNS